MHAAGCGADALGFIFYPKSARYIEPAEASRITDCLPHGVAKVGVFVNHDISEIRDIASLCRLDIIQLHGDESPEYCRNFSPDMIIKSVNLKGFDDFNVLPDYTVRAFLIDSREGALYGGTGKTSDWGLASRAAASFPLILSGGLNENNIERAVDLVAPDAVDINSGVEMMPGKKDHDKVRRIIDVLRRRKQPGPARTGIFTVQK